MSGHVVYHWGVGQLDRYVGFDFKCGFVVVFVLVIVVWWCWGVGVLWFVFDDVEGEVYLIFLVFGVVCETRDFTGIDLTDPCADFGGRGADGAFYIGEKTFNSSDQTWWSVLVKVSELGPDLVAE